MGRSITYKSYRNVSITMGMESMTRRPDLYDPAEANSKNAQKLKERLESEDVELYDR